MNNASTSIFAKKTITCGTCKKEINVKESRLVSKVCPRCGKTYVFDQAKSQRKECPSCGANIDALADASYTTATCPQCSCRVTVNKANNTYACPVCDYVMDVHKVLAKEKLVSSGGVSVIKYEGDNSTFVWKHPVEDFNFGSQLIVHETQDAIFFLNGEMLDTFPPGRHTLSTENLPILKKIYSLPTTGANPFHAEVYFVNRTVQMGMKWGTDSRVRFIDPMTGIPLDIGASGEMNLQVSDSRKLLTKLIGTASGLKNKEVLSAVEGQSQDMISALRGYFRAPLMTGVKSYLGAAIKEKNINILEVDAHLEEISEALHERIKPKFEEYGLTIPEFYVVYISLPESDPNFSKIKTLIAEAYLKVKEEEVKKNVAEAARQRQLVEEQTEAQKRILRAQGEAEVQRTTGYAQADVTRAQGMAEAEVMRAKGYTEKDVLELQAQQAWAEGIGNMGPDTVNGGGSGGGSMASDVVGMMAQMKMAGAMLDKMDGAMNISGGRSQQPAAPTAPANDGWTCPDCGETGNKKNFCMNCGKPKPQPLQKWTCPDCGETENLKNFCMNCGRPKPQVRADWTCPDCGETGNTKNFCMNCGRPKP